MSDQNKATSGDTQMYGNDASLKASAKKNNASPIGAILTGATEFLEGQPVKIKIAAGNGLTFQATNESGVVYDFTATGTFELHGKPQS